MTGRSGVHAHGCSGCGERYDDVCDEPNSNELCRRCQGFGVWELLRQNRLPRDCCFLHSRLATKDELKSYRLSTACDWFRCRVCARTFPFRNPSRSTA